MALDQLLLNELRYYIIKLNPKYNTHKNEIHVKFTLSLLFDKLSSGTPCVQKDITAQGEGRIVAHVPRINEFYVLIVSDFIIFNN